jgi:hypothetical protein
MSLSPQALFKGLVSRAIPTASPDSANNDVAVRQWTYGEQCVMPLVRKTHTLADEGSYFTASTATGIVPTYGTTQVATSPVLTVYNGSTSGQRLYLDYLALTAIAAGASTTTAGYTAIAVVVDQIQRYTSGGTALTSVCPNMSALVASPATITFGAITATAASGSVRTITSIRNIRPAVSATVVNVVGDTNILNFGGVEGGNSSITIANANIMTASLPPVVIGAGHTALLYIWYPVLTAPSAATYAPEIGYWVR